MGGVEIRDLEIAEVSLVDRAANRCKFIVLKRVGGKVMTTEVILTATTDEDVAVLKAVAENQGGLLAILRAATSDKTLAAAIAKAGLPAEAVDAVKTALKALESVKSMLPADIMKTLAVMAGYPEPMPEAPMDPAAEAADQAEDAAEDDMKAAYKNVTKADGSLDEAKIPKELRSVVGLLFKQNKANADQLATAQAVLKAEREDRKMKEFIAKADGLKHLSTDAARFGAVLKSASDTMPADLYAELEKVIVAADKGLSPLFKEVGVAADTNATPMKAQDQLAQKATEIRKRAGNEKLTPEQAFIRALDENPDLALRERQER